MVAESIRQRLRQLHEAGPGDQAPADDDDEEPTTKKKGEFEPAADIGQPPGSGTAKDISMAKEPGAEGEPTDDMTMPGDGSSEQAAADERDALDVDGDASEEPAGKINDAVSGKTVQSVTVEPKSKRLKGMKGVIIAFNETTDTLELLVGPSGKIAFYWRNQIHDMP